MGNYLLEDSLKEKIGDTYPLQRLKVVAENDEVHEYYELDKIVSDRQTTTGPEYLVKWKDCPESENTWLKPEYFSDKTLITKYIGTKNEISKGIIRRGRGRPRKIHNSTSALVTILLLIPLLVAEK